MTDGYTETRYYTMSNDNYTTYRDLVELNTKYNVVNSDSTVNSNSFIDDRLYTFFNIDDFNTSMSNNTIVINMSSSNIVQFRTNVVDDNTNVVSTYYGSIDSLIIENYKIDQQISELAKKVTDFFLISTALYGIIYRDDGTTTTATTPTNNAYTLINALASGITIEFTNISPSSSVGPELSDYEDLIIEKLYVLYGEALDELRLNDESNDDKYSSYLSKNLSLHSNYLNNFESLNDKQDKFDTKKAFVITMMAKAHKANKLYSTKKLWFTIYLSFLLVYILSIIGVIYASGSSNEMFSMFQNSTVGFVMVVFNAIILLSLFFYEISKYFYK